MECVYRVASLENIPEIVELKIDMFCDFGKEHLLSKDAREIIVEDYNTLYKKNLAGHMLAVSQGRIVAMAGAFIKSDIPYKYFTSSQYGFIGDVYTVPEFRAKGISSKLNQEALSWLKSRGIDCVRLLASDAGRPIYERLGFVSDNVMVLDNLQ